MRMEKTMSDLNYAPVCGFYCGDCHFLAKRCRGCGYEEGKPFWTDDMPGGICPIYDCCCSMKQLEHCGLCDEFPCKIFLELRDQDMSDEEFRESLDNRQKELRVRTEIGTEKWLAEKEQHVD